MENESLSLYDNRLQNKEINILKTILPYLGSTAQKNISMMISYLQMQKTMEYFENPENTMQISAMEVTNQDLLQVNREDIISISSLFHYLYYYHSICWSSSGICVLIFRRSVILPATLYLIGITSVPLPP